MPPSVARDRRSHDVDDPQYAGATPLPFAHRGQRVRGLAGLADREHQRAVVDHRVAIPELARVFDLDRDARRILEQVFPDQRRVPRGATGGEHDAIEPAPALFVDVAEPPQDRGPFGQLQAPAHGVADGLRLLEDLLEHEVRIAALLDLLEVPRDLVDRLVDVGVLEVAHQVPVARQGDHLAVVEIDDATRVPHDRRRVAGHEQLAVVDPDQQRAAHAGGHDLVGAVEREDDEAVRALYVAQRRADRVAEIAVVLLLDQVRDHFRVGLALEHVAALGQPLPQRARVLDDAVVDDRYPVVAAGVRVGVDLGRRAVGGPARMGEADRTGRRIGMDQILEPLDPPRELCDVQTLAVDDREAGGIVSTILHPPQALQKDRSGLLMPYISDDSTHGCAPDTAGFYEGSLPFDASRNRAEKEAENDRFRPSWPARAPGRRAAPRTRRRAPRR